MAAMPRPLARRRETEARGWDISPLIVGGILLFANIAIFDRIVKVWSSGFFLGLDMHAYGHKSTLLFRIFGDVKGEKESWESVKQGGISRDYVVKMARVGFGVASPPGAREAACDFLRFPVRRIGLA
eukprot:17225-Amorphochlora_amoeboformis.AAC.1